MKNTKKRAVKFLLAVFALISAFGAAMTVNAAAPKLSAKSATTYVNGSTMVKLKGIKTKDVLEGKVTCDVKYSKNNIAFVNLGYGEKKNSNACIYVSGAKKGKTKVTINIRYGNDFKKSKKLTLNVKVNKYTNPCASFTFGGKKYASKFKKDTYYISAGTLKGSKKISVKAKSGWKITEMGAWDYDYSKSKKIKNGQKINTSKYCEFYAVFENIKTKTQIVRGIMWDDGRYNYEDETDGL